MDSEKMKAKRKKAYAHLEQNAFHEKFTKAAQEEEASPDKPKQSFLTKEILRKLTSYNNIDFDPLLNPLALHEKLQIQPKQQQQQQQVREISLLEKIISSQKQHQQQSQQQQIDQYYQSFVENSVTEPKFMIPAMQEKVAQKQQQTQITAYTNNNNIMDKKKLKQLQQQQLENEVRKQLITLEDRLTESNPASNLTIGIVRYTRYVTVHNSEFKEIVAAFQQWQARSRLLQPDYFFFEEILRRCVDHFRADWMDYIFHCIFLYGIKPSPTIFNLMVIGHARCGNVDQAKKYLQMMIRTKQPVAWDGAVGFFYAAVRTGLSKTALQVLREFDTEGEQYKLSAQVFNIFFGDKSLHTDAHVEVLALAKKLSGVNSETFSAVVQGIIRAQRFEMVNGIISSIQEAPTEDICVALIHVYNNSRSFHLCGNVVKLMCHSGFQPSKASFDVLLGRDGQDPILTRISKLKNCREMVTKEFLIELMKIGAKSNSSRRVQTIYDLFPVFGYEPTFEERGILYSAYLADKKYDSAKYLVTE